MGVINEWIWQLSERKARDLLEISYVGRRRVSVSYTHLTLPTILRV